MVPPLLLSYFGCVLSVLDAPACMLTGEPRRLQVCPVPLQCRCHTYVLATAWRACLLYCIRWTQSMAAIPLLQLVHRCGPPLCTDPA